MDRKVQNKWAVVAHYKPADHMGLNRPNFNFMTFVYMPCQRHVNAYMAWCK
jgi:hypothetical protein